MDAATKELEVLLHRALMHYMGALVASPRYHADVFRVVSMWFGADAAVPPKLDTAAADAGGDGSVHSTASATIEQAATRVPSHVFLPLIYQLMSR